MDWMTTYARCAGCGSGGGPPGLRHQDLRRERGYEPCSSSADLEGCTRFDWMGETRKENRWLLR